MSRPPVIVAFLGTQALGDFVMCHVVAASIVRALPGSRLVVAYRDDRPYKSFVTLCNPYLTRTLPIPADRTRILPIDWFDGATGGTGRPFDAAWYEAGLHRPDLVLTPSMLDIGCTVGPPPRLAVPERMTAPLAEALAGRGVDRGRWFACVHMREDAYLYRRDTDPQRTVDPLTYVPMIRHVIETAGGQVVRIGDPSMTPLPDIDGLIDLSSEADSFPEQAYAVSRARFFIGTDTGPTQLASAFKTPAATTNALGIGVWNDGDVVLIKRYVLPDGTPVHHRDLVEMGSLAAHRWRPRAMSFVDNAPEQLVEVADHMLAATADCAGWRERWPDPPYEPPGRVSLPPPFRPVTEIARLVFWDDSGISPRA